MLVAMLLIGSVGHAHADDENTIVYVDASAPADVLPDDLGTSWDTAYQSLAAALANASEGSQIWIAAGTYYPSEEDRSVPFRIDKLLAVYGGFEGTETSIDERPSPVDPSTTVLSGDINQNGSRNGNSYTVLAFEDVTGAVLEGVTVSGGNANGGDFANGAGIACRGNCTNIQLTNLVIENNYADGNGAGLHLAPNNASQILALRNVVIRGNEARQLGGGIYVGPQGEGAGAGVIAANTVLSGNRASDGGGLAINESASAMAGSDLFNVTIHANSADDRGGGIYHSILNGELNVANSIIAGNRAAASGNEVHQVEDVAASFEASLVLGAFDGGFWDADIGIDQGGNIDGAPLFADAVDANEAPTTAGNVRLNWASPAVDAGRADLIPTDPFAETDPFYDTDLDGNPRVVGQQMNIGAFEGGAVPAGPTIYVDANASGDAGGNSWDVPYRTLQASLQAVRNARAAASDGFDIGALEEDVEVWVAEGTYRPDQGPGLAQDDITLSFEIPDALAVLGGFAGNEISADQRNSDPATNNTRLSGALGESNSQTVVRIGAATTSETMLDGFTISDGDFDDSPQFASSGQNIGFAEDGQARAAGVYVAGDATLNNLHIRDNEVFVGLFFEGTPPPFAGGLVCDGCSARFSNLTVAGNRTNVAGGGIYVMADEGLIAPSFQRIIIQDNAADAGGGMVVSAEASGSIDGMQLANASFTDNQASTVAGGLLAGSIGEDVELNMSSANVLFAGNTATEGTETDPSAAFFTTQGGASLDVTLAQHTVVGAPASDTGQALIGVDSETGLSSVNIANSIFWGSDTPIHIAEGTSGNVVAVNNSLVENGWAGEGSANIETDPLFDTDFRLLGNSPAIDAGNEGLLPPDATDLNNSGDTNESLPLDLNDEARVLADDVDMGAFEGGATPRALTEAPADVGFQEATFNATINPYSTETDVAYAFRLESVDESAPPQLIEAGAFAGSENASISAEATALEIGTTYQVRVEASVAGEVVTTGEWIDFTTDDANPPETEDFTTSTQANVSVDIDLFDLVTNVGEALALEAFAIENGPENGTLESGSDAGIVVYTPDQDFVGTDAFTYTVVDVLGLASAEATVTIDVTGDAPVAEAITFDADVNETLTVEAPGILENDDLGSPEAELTTITVGETNWSPGEAIDFAGGTLTVEADGSLTLDGPAEVGSFEFDYTLENAAGQSTAMVTIDVSGEAPVATAASFDMQVNETLTVEAPGALNGADLGAPEAAIVAVLAPADATSGETVDPGVATPLAGGLFTLNEDGSFIFEEPTEIGVVAAAYQLQNAAGESEGIITFDVEPDEEATPEPVSASLAPAAVGVRGVAQQVEVQNTGSSVLTDLSATLESTEHFRVLSTSDDGEVAPGEGFRITLAFAPQTVGRQSTRLNVRSGEELISVFDLSAKAIDVDVQPDEATAGTAFGVDVFVSDNFIPSDGQRLEARVAGESNYTSIALAEQEAGRWAAEVPAGLVTTAGVDLFVALSDEEGTVTVPQAPEEEAARTPLHVQVGIPATPAEGTFASDQYRMIALPVDLQERATTDVLAEAYGPYSPEQWRFFEWQSAEERYAEFPEVRTIQRGRAAWLITDTGEPFEVNNGQSFAADAPHEQVLEPGWNQISTPFGFAVAWDAVARPDAVQAPVAYRSPTPDAPPEYIYNRQQLDPWIGYFVYNEAPEPVTIVVPPVASGETSEAVRARASVDTEATEYSLQLIADLEGRALRHTQTFLGFRAGGHTEGHTDEPPRTFVAAPPVGEHVRVNVIDDATRYAGHYVSTPSEGYAWDIEVAAQTGGAFQVDHRVRVRLNETGTLPDGFSRYVIDLDAERPVDLQNQAFTADLPAGATTRRYRIVVGTESFAEQRSDGIPLQQVEDALHANFPNPVREGTTIAYDLSADTPVVIDIYNVLGQRVRQLVDREHSAGTHTVRWDGRNEAGQRVASGAYFYQIRTDTFSASKKMVVVR